MDVDDDGEYFIPLHFLYSPWLQILSWIMKSRGTWQAILCLQVSLLYCTVYISLNISISHLEWLSVFSLSKLRSIDNDYKSLIEDVHGLSPTAKIVSVHQHLNRFFQSWTAHRHITSSFAYSISTIWADLEVLDVKSRIASLDIHIAHQRYMMSNAIAWHWLDKLCGDHCERVLNTNFQTVGKGTDWLTDLTHHIHQHFSTYQRSSVTLHASSYIKDLPGSYSLPSIRSLSLEEATQRTKEIVIKVLETWLKYPHRPLSRVQGHFAFYLMETFTSDILLLDSVWRLYLRLRTEVLGELHSRVYTDWLAPIFQHLSTLPLADPDSPERRVLRSIGNSIESCIGLLAGTRPAIASPPVGVSSLITPGPHNYHNVLAFIVELLPLLDPSPPASPTPAQQTVVQNGFDKFLPFREHAPCRLAVISPTGPFHPSNIDRPGALASACIFRGITFPCPFIHDTPSNLFPDLAAWEQAVADFKAKPGVTDRDICDTKAYGTPMNRRSVTLAPRYFDAKPYLRSYLTTRNDGGRVNFPQLYKWLQHNIKAGTKMLPQMGSLITLLLAGDLVYAGKVAMPTAEEMGVIVADVKKGARSGLQDAFIISPYTLAPDVKDGFVGLYNYLDTELTPDQKARITFDPITLEHILCKYKRVGART